MLAKSSEEGKLLGLGWIYAEVKRLDPSTFNHNACIPHMGWNDVRPVIKNSLIKESKETDPAEWESVITSPRLIKQVVDNPMLHVEDKAAGLIPCYNDYIEQRSLVRMIKF